MMSKLNPFRPSGSRADCASRAMTGVMLMVLLAALSQVACKDSKPTGNASTTDPNVCEKDAEQLQSRLQHLSQWESTYGPAAAGIELPRAKAQPVEDEAGRLTADLIVTADQVVLDGKQVYQNPGSQNYTDEQLQAAGGRLAAQWADLKAKLEQQAKVLGKREATPAVTIVAARDMPAATVATLVYRIEKETPLLLAVADSAAKAPPPEPRPKIDWVEETIERFEEAESLETRGEILSQAVNKAQGQCEELSSVLGSVYARAPELAARRRHEVLSEKTLVQVFKDCDCEGVDMQAVEALLVWSMQPLHQRTVVELPYDKLAQSDQTSLGKLAEELGSP